MHYTRFASICQNSFNFESFTHYRKRLNHAVYAVYTKSAKLCPNHRKSTYSSGFMHFFRNFLPNLFLTLRFPPRYLWYFPYKEACFNCLFGIKTQQIVKEKKSRIVFHRQWINLLCTFPSGLNFRKFKKIPRTGKFSFQNSPPSLTFSSFPYILLQGLKGDALAAIRSSVFIVALFSRSHPYKNPAPLIFSDFPSLKIPPISIKQKAPRPPSLSKTSFKPAIRFFHLHKDDLLIPYDKPIISKIITAKKVSNITFAELSLFKFCTFVYCKNTYFTFQIVIFIPSFFHFLVPFMSPLFRFFSSLSAFASDQGPFFFPSLRLLSIYNIYR